jgi:hypothetical protein
MSGRKYELDLKGRKTRLCCWMLFDITVFCSPLVCREEQVERYSFVPSSFLLWWADDCTGSSFVLLPRKWQP